MRLTIIRMSLVGAAVIAVALMAANAMLSQQKKAADVVTITLTSDPYPLAVGQGYMQVFLNHSDGTPVTNAVIETQASMSHGMISAIGQASEQPNGEYWIPMVWSMPGPWVLDVAAQLPDTGEWVQDQFEIFVYSIQPTQDIRKINYPSLIERSREQAHPESELYINIPQGADAILRTGEEHNLLPANIDLSLSGQNVLVIQNNDVVDHTIGPFFVRSGETLRQEFTKPAVYVGVCTLRYDIEVSITVEE
ncbi:MAG: FixH family protein [Anaerolineae bacterium]|nr:FixH family protein [Anaerolineae bacterium]